MFNKADGDGNGLIDFQEWLSVVIGGGVDAVVVGGGGDVDGVAPTETAVGGGVMPAAGAAASSTGVASGGRTTSTGAGVVGGGRTWSGGTPAPILNLDHAAPGVVPVAKNVSVAVPPAKTAVSTMPASMEAPRHVVGAPVNNARRSAVADGLPASNFMHTGAPVVSRGVRVEAGVRTAGGKMASPPTKWDGSSPMDKTTAAPSPIEDEIDEEIGVA